MDLTEEQRLRSIDPQLLDPATHRSSFCCCTQESLYRDRVLQRVLDLCLAQEHVPAAHAPQHPLERGDALAVDHASHEPARGQHGLKGCT